MIYFLFILVLVEVAIILTLMFYTPLRKLVVVMLNRMKQGKGPVVATTMAATMVMVFISTLHDIMKVQKRSKDGGSVNPTDQVFMAYHILEASLMGFFLFLALMVDRLHYYVKELYRLRSLETMNKHKQDFEDRKGKAAMVTKASADGISALKDKDKQHEHVSNTKGREKLTKLT